MARDDQRASASAVGDPSLRAAGLAALASLGIHLGLAGALLAGAAPPPRPDPGGPVEVSVLTGDGAKGIRRGDDRELRPRSPDTPDPLPLGRPASRQNVDAYPRAGGGTALGAAEVVLLLSERSRQTRQDAPWNAHEHRQAQRIRTAPDRASRTNRRATPNPGSTPWLASRRGSSQERRPAGRLAQEGRPQETAPDERLPRRAATPEHAPDPEALASSGEPGPRDPRDIRRRGMPRARGGDPTVLAVPSFGRPPLPRDDAATATPWRSPRVRDNRNAELLVPDPHRSALTTTRGQARALGDGPGGVGGGGPAGAGHARDGLPGGRAQPVAPGPGKHGALDTRDPRYVRWGLRLQRRIASRLEFPEERARRMDQGTAVYRIRIRRNGRLAGPPELLRTSGFDDFDRNARLALEEALPAGALPSDLAPSRDVVPFTVPIQFWNPMVR